MPNKNGLRLPKAKKKKGRLEHNEAFESDFVQISKSYILNLDCIIHPPQGSKRDADIKMD